VRGLQIVSLCRGYARHLTVELGIVLQGECEDELPEKLIGCIGKRCTGKPTPSSGLTYMSCNLDFTAFIWSHVYVL
jgi:hypothetical protein